MAEGEEREDDLGKEGRDVHARVISLWCMSFTRGTMVSTSSDQRTRTRGSRWSGRSQQARAERISIFALTINAAD